MLFSYVRKTKKKRKTEMLLAFETELSVISICTYYLRKITPNNIDTAKTNIQCVAGI